MELITFSGWYSNNHILNSIGMKYSALFFGTSELALRLPGLLALLVYMACTYLLFKNSKPLVAISAFVLLCTNCLLMELFGLARGYGLSIGFMMLSLYHLVSYFRDKKQLHITLFHAGALLASLSNFTMLTYYVSALLVYAVYALTFQTVVLREKPRLFPLIKPHLLPMLVVVVVLYEPVRRVLAHTLLDFGGTNGFYQDTVSYLVKNTFHNIDLHNYLLIFFKVVFTLIVLTSLLIIVVKAIAKDTAFFHQNTGMVISCLLLVIVSIVIISLHYITGADYPVDRFSVYLFVLHTLHYAFVMRFLSSIKYKKLITASITATAVISFLSFWQKTDLDSSTEWAYDMNTKRMMQTLEKHHTQHENGERVNIGVNWLFEPTVNYYRITKDLDWLEPVDREPLNPKDDYYYISLEDLSALDPSTYEIIQKYENSNSVLVFNSGKGLK